MSARSRHYLNCRNTLHPLRSDGSQTLRQTFTHGIAGTTEAKMDVVQNAQEAGVMVYLCVDTGCGDFRPDITEPHFTLDGKPFQPAVLSLNDTSDRPSPGDLVRVGDL